MGISVSKNAAFCIETIKEITMAAPHTDPNVVFKDGLLEAIYYYS